MIAEQSSTGADNDTREVDPDIKHITSRTNAEIKKIRSLALRKHRDAECLFIAEGLNNAVDATRHGWRINRLVMETGIGLNDDAAALIHHVTTQGGLCMEVPRDIMATLTKRDNSREAIAVFEQKWDSLDAVEKTAHSTWVAIEEIRDPGNLGTIIRTAAAVGVEGIILIGNTCDPFSVESIRASVGSFAHIRFIKTTLEKLMNSAKKFRRKIVGTHLTATADYRTLDYKPPLLLVMGNEQTGLSDTLRDFCTHLVKIPMTGNTESLNISVATGIMLYEIFRNRL